MKCFSLLTLLFTSLTGASAQQYLITTIAGGAPPLSSVFAVAASIGSPRYVATDALGNVYFSSDNCIFKVDQAGFITRLAGNSRADYSGDGGPAISAQLNSPSGLALDSEGNIYVADSLNNRIRRISPSGLITTVAGTGARGYTGDGGPAASAQLDQPFGVAVDTVGNIFIADTGNFRVRKVSLAGIITTVAGSAGIGAISVTMDSSAALYIADPFQNVIRKLTSDGIITTIAGNGSAGKDGDGGPALSAELNYPVGVVVDSAGNIYIGDQKNKRIRKIISSGTISTLTESVDAPSGIALDTAGNLYVADGGDEVRSVGLIGGFRIAKISPNGTVTRFAGNGTAGFAGDDSPATGAQLHNPMSVATDNVGNIYIADTGNSRVRKVSSQGVISTVAGNGRPLQATSEGATATETSVNVGSIVLDGAGNLFIADYFFSTIHKVSPGGIITTVAGGGTGGIGDGGLATSATLQHPQGMAFDGNGNLFIADSGNSRIRKLSTTSGIITTVAGNGDFGSAGDGGQATSAELGTPGAVAVDNNGTLYIADGYRVRKVSSTGVITTVAGTGAFHGNQPTDNIGDGASATKAEINPYGITVDTAGDLYIVDGGHARIRKVTSDGIITSVAGKGFNGYSGDGGIASSAGLAPSNITVDPAGNLYIADNDAVRLLKPLDQPVLVTAVLDAATESVAPVAPGKVVVLYGAGLGPSTLAVNQPSNGKFGTMAGGTVVTFDGIPAPIIYAYSTQVSVIAPYAISGSSTVQVKVTSQNGVSPAFSVSVADTAPSFFSANQTGSGQIAAVNVDGSLNDATHPVQVGGYVSLYATGEGQTTPGGTDGLLAAGPLYPHPVQPVQLSIGDVDATSYLTYAGAAPTLVAGLIQIVVQIPPGAQTGGYVPVVLKVGKNATTSGAAWIAISGNQAPQARAGD
jgi:uncharacterized protein (TIGR03437 family)